jgi:hypothetical protein
MPLYYQGNGLRFIEHVPSRERKRLVVVILHQTISKDASLYITDAARNGKSCTANDPNRCS